MIEPSKGTIRIKVEYLEWDGGSHECAISASDFLCGKKSGKIVTEGVYMGSRYPN